MSTAVDSNVITQARRRNKTPFSISPNPNNLYFTPALDAAVFRVRFCVEQRQGLTVILGDVGLGKSSLVRYLHADFDATEDTISVMIPTPDFKSDYGFIGTLCKLVDLPPRRSVTAHQRDFEGWLQKQYGAGFNVVLFIDEAQKLAPTMLEMVRAFLNYETNEEKLVQVVLAGQLELGDRLLSPAQRPLRSRMVAPSTLSPLTLDELSAMIEHRCKLHKVPNPFPAEAVERLFVLAGGVPRESLSACALAFEMSKLAHMDVVTTDLIDTAFNESRIRGTAAGEAV